MEQNKERNFVSAVVYCCNDAATIGSFIENLDRNLFNNFFKYEIVVVNDCSNDNSAQIVREYVNNKLGGVISILNMSHPQGLEASMNAGVDLAIGDFVYEFDYAHIDFDWSTIMDVYNHSLKGYDIVSAVPKKKTKMTSSLYYSVFNRYANLQYNIQSERFRILSRRAINRIHSITQSVPFRKAAYAKCGLAVDFIKYKPTQVISRKKYFDKWNVRVDSIILFTDVAYRITMGLAIIMALFTAIFGIYAIVYKIMREPVEGWTTTILFMAFGFFGLFVIMAMVIKYLQTLVNLTFRKKNYLFESIEKLQ